jgi:hypothetical protein
MEVSGFSPHIFWDVNPENLSLERHFAFIVKRVLEYGLWEDWKILRNHYSIAEITEEVKKFRELDRRSLSFISTISKEPKEKFRCYTSRQSIPPHWTS